MVPVPLVVHNTDDSFATSAVVAIGKAVAEAHMVNAAPALAVGFANGITVTELLTMWLVLQ